MNWRTIDSAPKDGRTLLLGYPNLAGKWRTVRGQWMSQAYIDEYWEEPENGEPGWFETAEEADDVPNCWGIDPTHWMPLPPAPLAGSSEPAPSDMGNPMSAKAAPSDEAVTLTDEEIWGIWREGHNAEPGHPALTIEFDLWFARAILAATQQRDSGKGGV